MLVDRADQAIIGDDTRKLITLDAIDFDAFSDSSAADRAEVFFKKYKLWLLLLVVLQAQDANN